MKEYNWNYERDPISILEYVSRISEQISDVCLTMRECDGDMWLSEVRKLYDMEHKLVYLVGQIKKESEE
jgi:hypothetical protein